MLGLCRAIKLLRHEEYKNGVPVVVSSNLTAPTNLSKTCETWRFKFREFSNAFESSSPTHYVLFVISLANRVVEVLGVTARPDEAWMMQIGRNLVDTESGALRGMRYLIIDRNAKYTDAFGDW